MKFFNNLRVSWFILGICLLFQLSNTSPAPQSQVQSVTNPDHSQINYSNELSIDHQITKTMDINNSNTLEVHDDDEHYSLESRSDKKKSKKNKKANNSEKDHKDEFNELHLIWIVPTIIVLVTYSIMFLCENYEKGTNNNP
ncbi:putative membrane protein [Wickerhamomyces ciferrii]|uniref:Membrane protein n=1 Tax=Wickerhamomyces ciferrii (strain ATCC 14091 / BCRC 22168 / CBS 111 / JCM 3599 / NBRC 0793 / NRRL Y-1031 F-60-10) TaxID=1206466 RepID=K0KXU5_WICCF|nr:uncharacterized protein BN7_5485 [Wickerhamomyces ciferrii]CCH45898.1 putative membrane protein [Wickerhamomyces ciferrii]